MKQLGTSMHKDMSAYQMDFGFGGFVGYGSGVSAGLVKEELQKTVDIPVLGGWISTVFACRLCCCLAGLT